MVRQQTKSFLLGLRENKIIVEGYTGTNVFVLGGMENTTLLVRTTWNNKYVFGSYTGQELLFKGYNGQSQSFRGYSGSKLLFGHLHRKHITLLRVIWEKHPCSGYMEQSHVAWATRQTNRLRCWGYPRQT